MQDTIRHSLDPIRAVPDEVQRRALATVARHARGPEDLAELAEALGLAAFVEGGGSPAPLPPAPVQVAYAGLARAALAGGDEGQAHGGAA